MRTFVAVLLVCCTAELFTQPLSSIDVTAYIATVTFNPATTSIEGTVTLTVRNATLSQLNAVFLNLRSLTCLGVQVNGTASGFTQGVDTLAITLSSPLAPGDSVQIAVTYNGNPTNEGGSSPWGGCHWNDDSTSYFMGVAFTAPYVSMMRHWMPSNDIPSDKATFDITFRVPEGYAVASTGLLASTNTTDGYTAYRWVETHPTATYLFTYAIRRWAVVRDSWNGIPMEYYVPPQDSAKAVAWFAPVSTMMEAFTSRFGPYPYDKIGYCLTPIGSMEHQTMVSLAKAIFDFMTTAEETAAHELAHQWWGDCVTPKDFRDAWLSEGFAVFGECVYREHAAGRGSYVIHARAIAREYRNLIEPVEGTFPLYDFPRQSPSSNYPQTIYKKGGSVLVMLREVMGDSLFFEGMRLYRSRHEYANATTEQFRAAMEDIYGKQLDWFFDEWVYKPGYPKYAVESVITAGEPYRIRIRQVQDTTRVPLFRMPIPVTIVPYTGDTLHYTLLNEAVVVQEFSFPEIPSENMRRMTFEPEHIYLCEKNTTTVGMESVPALPTDGMLLRQNYPNPFASNEGTTLSFSLLKPASIQLGLYDTLGKERFRIADALYPAGDHRIPLQTNLPSGTYFVMLRSGLQTQVRQITVK